MPPHPDAPQIRRLLIPLLSASLLGQVTLAQAATGVSLSATRNGSMVEVSGSAVLPNSPPDTVATDAAGDVDAVTQNLSGDLTAVSLITQTDHDLVVRWSYVALQGEPLGALGVARFRFRAGSADYEVAAARNDHTGASQDPGGWLTRCGSGSCVGLPAPDAVSPRLISRDVGVQLDFQQDVIEATVPVTALAGILTPGSAVQPHSGNQDATVGFGELEADRETDTAIMTSTYNYGLSVHLGTADPAAAPESVDYTVPATVAQDGIAFSGSLEVTPGLAVFARACLGGPANCAYAATPAT